jgi:hypothetical protein
MNIFNINTTAYNDEDFMIVTNLTQQQVIECITPIVEAERNNEQLFYDNDMLVNSLTEKYPNSIVLFDVVEKIVI